MKLANFPYKMFNILQYHYNCDKLCKKSYDKAFRLKPETGRILHILFCAKNTL